MLVEDFLREQNERLENDAKIAEYLDFCYGKYCQNLSELPNYIRKGIRKNAH